MSKRSGQRFALFGLDFFVRQMSDQPDLEVIWPIADDVLSLNAFKIYDLLFAPSRSDT